MGRHTKPKSSMITLAGHAMPRGSAKAHAKAFWLPYTACTPAPTPQLQAARLGPRPGHQPVVVGVRTRKTTRVPSSRPSKQCKRARAERVTS